MDTNNTNTSLLFSRIADSVRDKVETKKLEINATVQEKLPEWKSRGQLYGNLARETGMEWSRKGKEAVDRWRKEFNSSENKEYAPLRPTRSPPPSPATDSLGIFGMPLEQAVELTRSSNQDTMVPAVVDRCIKYLEQHGLKEVGIYRISGSQTALNKLRAVFDSGSDIDLETVQPDAHVVSALLKMYIRELPEPIIPRDIGEQYSNEITNALQEDTDLDIPRMTPALIQSIRNITNQLPVYNQCLLQTLFRHLKHVADNQNENRMSTSNLAVVFIPTLGIGRALFHCMIEHYQQIYKPPPPIPAKPLHVINRRFPTHQPKTRSDTDLMSMTKAPPSSTATTSNFNINNNVSTTGISTCTTTTTTTTTTTATTRIPPAKPMRKSKEYHHHRERSKSVSTTQATPQPSWRRRAGSRVEALGRQFESQWNNRNQ